MNSVVVVACALALALSSSTRAAAAEITPDAGVADLSGVTYVSSNGTNAEIVLAAARAQYAPDRGVVVLHEVDLRIEGGSRDAGLALTCETGDLDLETGDFIARGDVRGRTGNGRRFETEEVIYSHADAIVSTDQHVVIRDRGGTMAGRGFRYDTDAGRFQLIGASVVQQ